MRFDRDRLIMMALIVLDEVCDQCSKGPVKPAFSIKLALACLYALGKGERSQFEAFWNEMRRTTYGNATPNQIAYSRATNTRTHLNGIARSVGVELCGAYLSRLEWARGHRPKHPWKQMQWLYDEKAKRKTMAVGWKLDREQREELLGRFPPIWPDVIADHVTLSVSAGELPPAVDAQIVGHVDDGEGLQALVVAIDGTTARLDGSVYHITWSLDLARGRRAAQSNDVLAAQDWRAIAPGIPIELMPAVLE